MQKGIVQNARKTAHQPQGHRTEVLGKMSGVQGQTEIASESARQTWTPNWRHLPAQVADFAPMADMQSHGGFMTKLGVNTGKMSTPAQRNRFFAKGRS